MSRYCYYSNDHLLLLRSVRGTLSVIRPHIDSQRLYGKFGHKTSKKQNQIAHNTTIIFSFFTPLVGWKNMYSKPHHLMHGLAYICLLYTSDAADDLLCVDLGGRRIIKKKNNKKSV
eukprot:TRINITY_DN3533_c0_g1_i2.p1 TRINITY_DN3533_c0_g1~~TRINITY_DN3533_c0_g1_i2.p1  ORF type:complete len:116 (-),score=9.29 TRINITY_DN3533_c0_g1_i2:53-400(-)